jgi:iron complex outermembrane receptor protein
MMRRYKLSLLLAGTAISGFSGAVAAQEPVTAQMAKPATSAASVSATASASPSSDEAIVVTGSRIVRDGYTAPTPVTVATASSLLSTTPSSIPDGLNKLPQFANSLSGARAASNFSNLPIHGNVLNLRGLGTTGNNPKGPLRTLILFNGMRVAPTSYVGTIDTNVIPQMLLSRVDVVTGGASANWGSDAVAGVVNFILDKKFTGYTGVAQYGIDERGTNENQRLGVAGGWDFAGGKGHILLSGEYSNNNGMQRIDRNVSNQGFNFVGANPGTGPNGTNLQPGSAGNPFTIGSGVLISSIATNGRITGSSVAGNPFVGQAINNDGSTRPFDTGTRVGTTGFQSGGDGYRITQRNTAVIPVKNYQTFGRASYDVTDDVTAYVQGIFARSDFTYPTQTNALVGPSQAVQIFSGNPFLSPALAASIPTAGSSITIQQYDAGQPQPIAKERTNYWLATAGLEGKFGNGFTWSVNYTHGDSKHNMDASGLYDNKKLYAAADAVVNPANGQITCRVLLDPAFASQYAGCTPVNFLRGDPSVATPAGYAYVTGTSSYIARIKQDSFTANLTGTVFELPAGPVDFAVGAEYRKQSLLLTSNADPATLAGTSTDPVVLAGQTAAIRNNYFAGLRGVPSGALYYWLTNVGSARGSESVKEAYAEVSVPILKDTPGFQSLSINGAVRITDYSVSGSVATWKGGVTWAPVEDLLLRGTYSRDIRAPNLFELFSGAQSGIGIVNDTVSGLNQNVSSVTAGNPGLQPETAKTLTIGGVFKPSFMPGFSASIDYYSIKVNKLIDQLSAQQILTNCNNSAGAGPECALITRATPTSFPTSIRIAPANIAFLKTAGIDFDATYRTSVGDGGSLGIRLYANYLDKFDTQQFNGAPTLHYAGVSVVASNPAGYPRWRGNLTVDYSAGPFGFTISEQMIGKMRLDVPGNLSNGARSFFVNDSVKAVFYTDLALRYKIPAFNQAIEAFVTVNNLFDRSPPLIPGAVPGVNFPTNIAVYDVVGRAYTAGVRFKF